MENNEFSKEAIKKLYEKVERSVTEHLRKKMPYHIFSFSKLKATEQSYERDDVINGTEIFRIEIGKSGTSNVFAVILFKLVSDEDNQKQAIKIMGKKHAPFGFTTLLRSGSMHIFFEEFILPEEDELIINRKLFGLNELLTVMLEDLSIIVSSV